MSQPDARGAPVDPVIRTLAEAIRKGDWTRIDAAWGRFRIPRGIHLRRDAALDADAFLLDALSTAQSQGILVALICELIREDLLADSDLRRISDLPQGPAWEIHAFQNDRYLPVNALLEGKNLLAACDHVCRIDIDEQHVGTGVQVSPMLVATAAHVIEPLIALPAGGLAELRARGPLCAAEDSLGRLSVTFCYAEDYTDEESLDTQRRAGEVVSLYPRWLAWGSLRAVSDDPASGFGVTSTEGITIPDGPWDLALIRLAAPRRKPRPTRLLNADLPAKPFQINILHHPNGGTPTGQPLLISRGSLNRPLGRPAVRCLHDASTHHGSSGAPVFDSQWRIVALHQGGTQAVPPGDAGGGHNRAVPVQGWRDHVESIERSLGDGVPYLRVLKTSMDLTPYPYPVIGRRETQRRVWRAMRPDATPQDRLLIVRGARETGRRFTKRLVREMVSSTDGVLAALDMANTLDDSVAGFVERIAGALSAQLRLPRSAWLTTRQRAIRDDLVPVLGQLLQSLAGDRAVWLVLEGFGDASAAIPATVTDVISDLGSRLRDFPSLRLVLVGWTLTPVDYERSVEELRLATADDVVWYLCPPGDRPESRMVEAVRSYFKFIAKGEETAYPIAQQIALTLSELLHKEIDQGGGP